MRISRRGAPTEEEEQPSSHQDNKKRGFTPFARGALNGVLHLLFWTIVGVISLGGVCIGILQFPAVQRYMADRVSNAISDDVISIRVHRVRLTPLLKLEVRNVLVQDAHHDTLMRVERLQTSLKGVSAKGKHIALGQTAVRSIQFNLLYDSSGTLNLTQALQHLIPNTRKKKDTTRAFTLDIQSIRLVDGIFRLHKYGASVTPGRINFSDLNLHALNVDARHFRLVRDSIQMEIKTLRCHDHSGYRVESFSTLLRVCKHSMHFFDLHTSHDSTALSLSSLRMEYSDWSAMKYFIDSVRIESEIDTSTLSTSTLSYFMPLKTTHPLTARIAGRFQGSVSDFRLRNLDVRVDEKTHFRLDGYVAGLPTIQNVIANIEVKTLDTDAESLVAVANAFVAKRINMPTALSSLKDIHFQGNLTGFFGDFVSYGRLDTDVGSVKMDMGVNLKKGGHTEFNGKIHTEGLRLDRILGSPLLGKINLSAQTKGEYNPHLGGVKAWVNSKVTRFDFRGHSYSNIDIEGQISPKGYKGKMKASDSIVQLQFDGMVDFTAGAPVFQFTLDVPHADLAAIGVLPRDSTAIVSFAMRSLFQGNKLDNAEGEVIIQNIRYQHARGVLQMNRISLMAENASGGGKEVRVDSPALQAKLWGLYRYDEVPHAFARLMRLHTRAIVPDSMLRADSLHMADLLGVYKPGYTLLVRINDVNPLLNVFYPRLQIDRGSELQAVYDPKSQRLSAHLTVNNASFDRVKVRKATLEISRKDSILSANLDVPTLSIGQIGVDSTLLQLQIGTNRARIDLHSQTPQLAQSAANVHLDAYLRPAFEGYPPSLMLRPSNTSFTVQAQRWDMSNAHIVIDTTMAQVHNFILYNGQNTLSIDGKISAGQNDTLSIGMDNVDLSLFSNLMPPGRTLTGKIRGKVNVGSILDTIGAAGNFTVENFMLGGAYVGNLTLGGAWRRTNNILRLHLNNRTYDGREDIAAHVDYNPQQHLFNGTLRLDAWDYSVLRSLTLDAVQSRGGRLNGQLSFSGSPESPSFDGTLRFDDARVFVQKLGKSFSSSSSIKLQNQKVIFDSFEVNDLESHALRLDGYVALDTLQNPFVSLTASADRFQLLRTNARINPTYYGNLTATTQTALKGRLKDLYIQLRARTEAGTELTFQLPQQSSAKENKNLEFVVPPNDTLVLRAQREAQQASKNANSSFNMEMQLEITPTALLNIVIDPSTGGAISAHGNGNLQIIIPKGNKPTLLYGEYSISRGEYNFVLGSILTKKFTIESGSSIQFNGNPSEAQLDVRAVHQVRTSLDKLVMSDAERYKRRVEVACSIHIQGTASNPRLSFDISVPHADAEMQALIATALNSDEKKMRQFASLLTLGMFFPDSRSNSATVASSNGGAQMSNLVISSLSDFLFSQINSWLSSSSGVSVGLGVNYNMADGTSTKLQDETEVSFSMQLDALGLNIDANWDVSKNNTTSAVAGDVNVSKQSKYVKNLQYKAFARSNDNLVFSDLSPYTAGVGVSYSDSFNSLKELWERIKSAFYKKRNPTTGENKKTGDESDETSERNADHSDAKDATQSPQ